MTGCVPPASIVMEATTAIVKANTRFIVNIPVFIPVLRLKKDHFYTFLSFSNALSRTFFLFYLMSGYALNCNKRQSKNPVGS